MVEINQMLKRFWDTLIFATEISAYQRTLREFQGIMKPEQLEEIRKRIFELASKQR